MLCDDFRVMRGKVLFPMLRHRLDFFGDIRGQRRRLVLHHLGRSIAQAFLKALAAALHPVGENRPVKQIGIPVVLEMPQLIYPPHFGPERLKVVTGNGVSDYSADVYISP